MNRIFDSCAGCPTCIPADLLISPSVLQYWEEKAKAYGPGVSGALFGGGWWFWVDACAASGTQVPFVQYLPGIVATIALVMINAIRRDELEEYDPFDEGVFCRSRFWLFISYIVSFASVVGAVWVLLGHYALNPDVSTVWPGIAGLFQVTLILGAALLFWVARTPSSESSYSGYGAF
ncbi:hypothetical protein CVIRNUC_004677 [Coccomyxa viridis]|uniref:Uncharacterized protein n=1 Tax=Coccomyxa viridis TaxID=1274662 RepID=A0AAV1I3C0_9CHLO|nr:hypothetical protein CVIRNUC_004677 [Coccomyxa viridis]